MAKISDADIAAIVTRAEVGQFIDSFLKELDFPDHKGRPGQVGGSLPRDAGEGDSEDDFADEVRKSDVEEVAVFKGGKLLGRDKGGAENVKTSIKDLRGTTVIHNHPDGYSSFSRNDIVFGVQEGVSKMVVVAGDYTYTMEIPEGMTLEQLSTSWNSHTDEVVKVIKAKKLPEVDAVRRYQNMMWSRVANDTGMKYSVDRK